MNIPTSTAWRSACLRGVALGPEGPHALVAVAAGQYLRVPLTAQTLPRWQSCIGRRVWIDAQARPVRMYADTDAGFHHA
ncbi:MAG: hypothetical protein AB9M60_17975 [Leptothrix sp. (in: b-proteobacteria)]